MKHRSFGRFAALLIALCCVMTCVLPASAIQVAQSAPEELENALIAWDPETAPDNISGWLSDYYNILWGGSYAIGAGNLAASVVSGKGVDCGRALKWTQINAEWGNNSYVEFSKSADAVTDWSKASDLYFYVDASEVNTSISFELFLYTAASTGVRMTEKSTVYLWKNGNWSETNVNQWQYFTLPAAFKGWVRVPLQSVYAGADLGNVQRLGIMAEHSLTDVSIYFDDFALVGAAAEQKENPDEALNASVVWDAENAPDNIADWMIDKYVDMGWSAQAGISAGTWKPVMGSGKGYDGGRALGWQMLTSDNSDFWKMATYLDLLNDGTAVTDWSGAINLYFYMDASAAKTQLPVDLLLYANGQHLEMAHGAAWYYWAAGRWIENTINDWGHMLIPAGYSGWIRLPLTGIFGADIDLSSVTRIGFYTENTDTSATIWFDDFRTDADAPVPSEFRFSETFGSDMVLQADKPISLFGFAAAGDELTVTVTKDDTGAVIAQGSTTADAKGKWSIKLPQTVSASYDTYTVTLSKDAESKTLTDVVFGEVWISGGQSNMELMVCQDLYVDDIRNAERNPDIHVLHVTGWSPVTPMKDPDAVWKKADSWSSIEQISAVGYYFAEQLQQELDVPVGIVCTAAGGTSLHSWIDTKTLTSHTDYLSALTADGYHSGNGWCDLYVQYNSRIAPLAGMQAAGIIWYQGCNESGINKHYLLEQGLPVLYESWNKIFNQTDTPIPFYAVELTPYETYDQQRSLSDIAIQNGVKAINANGGIAESIPTYDITLEWDGDASVNPMAIHPRCKQPIGQRLCALALGYYGLLDICVGPKVDAFTYNDDGSVVVKFTNVGTGLKTTDGEALKGFLLAKDNGVMIEANAEIIGTDTVKISPDPVWDEAAKRVMYAYGPSMRIGNLCNSAGYLCSTFADGQASSVTKLVWSFDGVTLDPANIFTQWTNARAGTYVDAQIAADKGYDGSDALAYIYKDNTMGSDTYAGNMIILKSVESQGCDCNWASADTFWFWTDASAFKSQLNLEVQINDAAAEVGAPCYLWDGVGEPTESKIVDWHRVSLPVGYVGWVGIPLSDYANLDKTAISTLQFYFEPWSDVGSMPKTLYLDEFWASCNGDLPLLEGRTAKPAEANKATVIWDMENTPDDISGWLSDLYYELWGATDTGVSAGNWSASVVDEKGVDGSRALAWTQPTYVWGNSSFVKFSNDSTAITDWSDGEDLLFYMDASETTGDIKSEIFLFTAADGVVRAGEATAYLWQNGSWSSATINQWSEMTLPAGFAGWIRLPLADVYTGADLSNVERIGFFADHHTDNATVYYDYFALTGISEEPVDPVDPPTPVEPDPEEIKNGVVVWDMENIPDDMIPWAIDKYVELWGSEDIGVAYEKWTPSGVDGKGYQGSRALAWTTYENTWGNNTFLMFGNDRSARTDWSGATKLYVYVDISEVKISGTMPVDITLYTAANGAMEMQEGASWYYLEDGNWVEAQINVWKHMLIPADFKGWICIPLKGVFGAACDVSNVQRLGFLTEHNVKNGTVYFDRFMIDKCDATISYDPAALQASKTDINLVPSAKEIDSADYFCTWNLQGSKCGGNVTVRDVLTDEALFGENGWAYCYPEEVRKDLRIILDDGWDLPYSENGKDNDAFYGSFILDEEKFPNYGDTYPERLKTLVDKFKAAGWGGVGVWVCCQEDAAHKASSYDRSYWVERIEWCKYAGISYWKIDWGTYCYDLTWRQFITDAANRIYPDLIIEHISGDVGTNDPLGSGTCDPKLNAMTKVAAFSDVFRTYDVTSQLSFSTTMERVTKTLANAYVYQGDQLGLLNCEDELYLAAALGMSGGIMRCKLSSNADTDEASRMVMWHRIAPSFAMTASDVKVSSTVLSDVWAFTNDTWDSTIQNRTITQYAAAAVSRGIDLPTVTSAGEVPYLAASRNPLTGAISVGSFRRTSVGAKNHTVKADIALNVGALTGDIGIFGVYNTLTLTFAENIEGKQILAQDLLGKAAFDITEFVTVNGNTLILQGDLLAAIGTDSASISDTSEPGLVLRIGDPADYTEIPAAQENRVAGPSMKITLPTTTDFCTVSGASSVSFGETYTFTVSAKNGYSASGIIVKANGIVISGENGAYTLPCVMSNQVITVEYKIVCDHTNTEVLSAVPATCIKPGLTEGLKCVDCGEVLTAQEEIPALGHSYENGICTVCGEKMPEVLKISSAYLRLDEDIDIIYAATVPEDCTAPYMVFRYNGASFTVQDYTEEDGKYLFEFEKLVPYCMGDNISATLYAKQDGRTVSDTVANYSIRTYCENQLAKTKDVKLTTLLSDLLTYGAAAQIYTGYKTDALVTDGLELTPSTFTAFEGKQISFTGEKSGFADWYSAALVMSNDLAMRFCFTAESVEGLSAEITISGRTQTFDEFESLGEGKYALTFRGIKATEFDDTVTASIKQNGETLGRTLCYSVNTYICDTQDKENIPNLAQLMQAVFNYGASAAAYAGN